MKNQEDIGNAIGAIYGAAAGTQLTSMLKEHITIAVDLIKAAKAGDKTGPAAGGRQMAAERGSDRRVPEQSEPELAPSDSGRHDEDALDDDDG